MLSNVIAFPRQTGDILDPLAKRNWDHAYIAMRVADQYDAERIDGFIRELISGGRAGDIADILNNNARAIRWLMGAADFLIKADEAISAAADRLLGEALAEGGVHV